MLSFLERLNRELINHVFCSQQCCSRYQYFCYWNLFLHLDKKNSIRIIYIDLFVLQIVDLVRVLQIMDSVHFLQIMDSIHFLQSWTQSTFYNHGLSPLSTIMDSVLFLQSWTQFSFYNHGFSPLSTIMDSVHFLQSQSKLYNHGLSLMKSHFGRSHKWP
jgi:hypothetical protein